MLQMQLQLLFLAYKVTTVAACSTLCSHETLVLGSIVVAVQYSGVQA